MSLILLLMALPVHAAYVQYRVSDFQVVGAFETLADMVVTPDTAPLEIPGVTVADIPWPIPVGCLSGKKEWTQVTPPGELPLVLDPSVVVFSTTSTLLTGCRQVENSAQLHRLVEQRILTVLQQYPFIAAMAALNTVTFIAVCPTTSPAACASARSQMVALNNTATLFPTPAQLNNFLGQITTMKDDAIALKQAQCTANPGGPFC